MCLWLGVCVYILRVHAPPPAFGCFKIKGHNQREYDDKLQGWQNWTDEKLATKLTKDD